jgi:hypothetical protein
MNIKRISIISSSSQVEKKKKILQSIKKLKKMTLSVSSRKSSKYFSNECILLNTSSIQNYWSKFLVLNIYREKHIYLMFAH